MNRGKITSGIQREIKTSKINTKNKKSKLSSSTAKALSLLLGIYTVSICTIYFFDIAKKTDSHDDGFEMIFSRGEIKDTNIQTGIDMSGKLTVEYQESVEAAARSYIEMIEKQLTETIYGDNTAVFLSTDKAMPINGTVTSGYSERKNPFYVENSGSEEYEFHRGIDIEAPIGTSVFSYSDGTVITTSASNSYGNYIIVSHGNYDTLYAHLDTIVVNKGDKVNAGQTIAFSGNTGRSTGPHLHFEVRVSGEAVDPALYLKKSDEGGI